MPFTFNNIALYTVTVGGKPWIRSREVCRALKYGKVAKTEDIVKPFCIQENYAHKC